MSSRSKIVITFAALVSLSLGLFSCKVGPPKGVTAFVVDDTTEYASAMLLYPKSEEYRLPLKLKYVDTNTFQTTATLAPGSYTLVVRTDMGRYVKIPVEIEANKRLYRVSSGPLIADEDNVKSSGSPRLRGKITIPNGQPQAQEVVAIFVDRDVTVKRATVAADGQFEIEAPRQGQFHIELFALSPKDVWKWESKDPLEVKQTTELSSLNLRKLD